METSGCTGYRMQREAQDLLIDWKWGQRERGKFEISGRASRRLELPLRKLQDTGGPGL